MKAPNPTPAVKALHAELPIPQAPSWLGYWTFVTALILAMFVLYTAKQGTLSTWISFLGWGTPAPLGSASGTATVGSTIAALVSGATGAGGLFAGGSTDPVAGSVSTAVSSGAGSVSNGGGAALGLGN